MKHVIDFPDEIEQALEKRASETGQNVAHLIEAAVIALVRNDDPLPPHRKPDPPLETVEVLAPCDLPRSAPRSIVVEKSSGRMPDPIADSI